MTQADVAAMIEALSVVHEAADVLAAAGLSPIIDLTDDATVLTAAPVLDRRPPLRPDGLRFDPDPVSDPDGAALYPPRVGRVEVGELVADAEEDGDGLVLIEDLDTGVAGEAPQPGLAGGQDAEAPPPAEDVARGAFPGGGQDLPAIQPGVTAPAARDEGTTGQPPEPAGAAPESGPERVLAAAEHSDPAPVRAAPEPPAVEGDAPAVEAPDLPAAWTTPGGGRAGGGVVPAYGAVWTAAEDDALVAGVAKLVRAGSTRNAAAKVVAARLGRGEASCRQRIFTGLKARIDAALADAAQVAVLDDAAQEPVPVAVAEPAALPPAKPASAPLVRPGHLEGEHLRIWDWLDGKGRSPDFTAADDLAIWDAYSSGAGVAMLAADWGMDSVKLKLRYEEVTACICDAKARIKPELRMKLAKVLRWRADAAAKLSGAAA